MSLAIGLFCYFTIGIVSAWLDLTGRLKRPCLFFGLGALSVMPLLFLVVA